MTYGSGKWVAEYADCNECVPTQGSGLVIWFLRRISLHPNRWSSDLTCFLVIFSDLVAAECMQYASSFV